MGQQYSFTSSLGLLLLGVLLRLDIITAFPSLVSTSYTPFRKSLEPSRWICAASLDGTNSLSSSRSCTTSTQTITTQDHELFIWNTEKRRNQRLKRLQSVNASRNLTKTRPRSNRKSHFLSDDLQQDHEDDPLRQTSIHIYKDSFEKGFLHDKDQMNSILSDAPAILLESGAGTGKTTVLAGRIAHLIQTQTVQPQHMIVLSFTNRDSLALKQKAMDILYCDGTFPEDRSTIEHQLWSGTIHSFAMNILKRYNSNHAPVQVISTKEMKNIVRRCLGRLNGAGQEKLALYRKALDGCNQNVEILIQYIIRCLELWKEGGILPTSYSRFTFHMQDSTIAEKAIQPDDYVEVAMRIGIPQTAAALALEIVEDYQSVHATMGTADPSDVAFMAYDFLITHPGALFNIRSKLRQIILDEYQDVSVSQHRLIRLVVLGATEEELSKYKTKQKHSRIPIMTITDKTIPRHIENICYNVPKIICAGDSNQSIYGWRGAAPSLTVDGFRSDFPQGLVVPLNTCYRLPRHILNAANVLIGQDGDHSSGQSSFEVSPSAAKSAASMISNYVKPSSVSNPKDSIYASGRKFLLKGGIISESRSAIFIQGLWDAREEAKYIASEIRKKYKQRMKACSDIMTNTDKNVGPNKRMLDSSDVAVMARSKNQLKLIEAALREIGIPCFAPKEDENSVSPSSKAFVKGNDASSRIFMKPVQLITMHQAKGDEFDDVYLAGWTEGVFPHPASLKSNRLHEERRIAYVALTRARQRVVLTYSCVSQDAYFGPGGKRKDVTKQVEPSRFLYDLFSSNESGSKGSLDRARVEWSESVGFKEIVAGRNLPDEFANSYRIPSGYQTGTIRRVRTENLNDSMSESIGDFDAKTIQEQNESATSCCMSTSDKSKSSIKSNIQVTFSVDLGLLDQVHSGLHEVFQKKRGSQGRYKENFRIMLHEQNYIRGRALILTPEGREIMGQAVDALVHAPSKYVTSRPFSQCTAEQLGLFLVYVLLGKKKQYQC